MSVRAGLVAKLVAAGVAVAGAGIAVAGVRVAMAGAGAERAAPGADLTHRCEPIRMPLTPTRAGLGAAGHLELVMAASPFGITVEADGHHVYDVTIRVERLRRRPHELYVAWATTPELDRVVRLGVLGEDGTVHGRLAWNKFLVLVSAETEADGERWRGPILLTGLSPSGLMHTMRGHGIFEAHGIGC